MLMNSFKANCL